MTKYYKTTDDLKSYMIEDGVVTEIVIQLDGESLPLKYNSVGVSSATAGNIESTCDEVTEEDYEDVIADVITVARVGGHPTIKPH